MSVTVDGGGRNEWGWMMSDHTATKTKAPRHKHWAGGSRTKGACSLGQVGAAWIACLPARLRLSTLLLSGEVDGPTLSEASPPCPQMFCSFSLFLFLLSRGFFMVPRLWRGWTRSKRGQKRARDKPFHRTLSPPHDPASSDSFLPFVIWRFSFSMPFGFSLVVVVC